MFGYKDLKETIGVTESTVECPVKGCTEIVVRQKQSFACDKNFMCPAHNIFISPSTFEYDCELRNLLWKDPEDVALLSAIFQAKRESRMARERSEDAVSWNVFRYLEKNDLITDCLASLLGGTHRTAEIIYWSHSQTESKSWSILNTAREMFGEIPARGSEPDIIIITDTTLFFIEAKFTSGNKTKPSNSSGPKKYETGADNWYARMFNSDYHTVAVDAQKYELMRFWLLGTWMASDLGLDFYLVNLVRGASETNIERDFKPHIVETSGRKFMRLTWEEIYNHIAAGEGSKDKQAMLAYYLHQTAGYNANGILQRAFSL